MKKSINSYCLKVFLAALLAGVMLNPVSAQEAEKQPDAKKPAATEQTPPAEGVGNPKQKDEKTMTDADRQAGRREMESEAEAELQPYFNNYFKALRFGPQDIVSVLVFNHEKYSMVNITVPPDGRLNYPLIGQIVMVGRTQEDVQKEIAEKLSEYIIEPKVTVQIVQSRSMKYMVIGDVGKPGPYEMNRRMSVLEAIAEAGDVTRYGDAAKVSVLRLRADGSIYPNPINLREMQRGKGAAFYLSPGDVIFVPGNKFKTVEKVMQVVSLGSFMRTIVR